MWWSPDHQPSFEGSIHRLSWKVSVLCEAETVMVRVCWRYSGPREYSMAESPLGSFRVFPSSDHVLAEPPFGGVDLVLAAGRVDVVVAGAPAELRGVDPSLELGGLGARRGGDGDGAGLLEVLGAAGVLDGVVAPGELQGFA